MARTTISSWNLEGHNSRNICKLPSYTFDLPVAAAETLYSRAKSPYTLSYGGQVKLCLRRGFQRLRADPSLTLTQLFGNFIMALIVGSVFYNMR